jgi:transposase-like protein
VEHQDPGQPSEIGDPHPEAGGGGGRSIFSARRGRIQPAADLVCEAYVAGVSTRRVDDLVRSLGITGISKSEVSRMCTALDAEVSAFRTRSLAGERYPYLWLDATYLEGPRGGQGGQHGGARRDRGRPHG